MKLRDLLYYFTVGEKVKLIILDGSVYITIYHDIYGMPKWVFETLISTIEIDDYCLCIRTYIPEDMYLQLQQGGLLSDD